MSVGKIISGSQLLQKAEHTEFYTSARERSVDEQVKSVTIQQVQKQTETNEKNMSKDQTKELVESMNEFLEPIRTSLKFEYHEKLEDYYVTIVDSETKEVVKEIPPKKLLDAYASMAELMGFIVDESV